MAEQGKWQAGSVEIFLNVASVLVYCQVAWRKVWWLAPSVMGDPMQRTSFDICDSGLIDC